MSFLRERSSQAVTQRPQDVRTPAPSSTEPDSGESLSLGQRMRQPRTLISFVLALAIVVFFVSRLDVDFRDILRQIRAANPFIFAGAVLLFYLGMVIRTYRWRLMLRQAGLGSEVVLPRFRTTLAIVILSFFVNCVVPAKLGDVYRAYLLKRRCGAPASTTMGTIVAERFIDLVVLFVLLILSGLLVFGRHFPGQSETIVIYGGAVVIAGIAALAVVWRFRAKIMTLVPSRWGEPVDRIQRGLFDNLRNPWKNVGLSVLLWVNEGIRFFLVAWSLSVALQPSTAIFLALMGSLASVMPFTPAGLGVVEAVMMSILPYVGVRGEYAGALAILERVISYWSLIVVGIPLYLIYMKRSART